MTRRSRVGEQLVAEEHGSGRASPREREQANPQRLQELRVSLDQCWDLARTGARCAKQAWIRTLPQLEHSSVVGEHSSSEPVCPSANDLAGRIAHSFH